MTSKGLQATEGFHPAVRAWFAERFAAPTPVQARVWPKVRAGGHVLAAAPTGSGKTLAAFLAGLDALLAAGPSLPDETRLVYVSPLRALSNDVQRNLLAPLAELRARDPSLPEVRVLVRHGDTSAAERARMKRRPPHVLVTTPESLYVLLGSEGGRALLRTVRTAIVDEVHAVLGDKRGAHLALSLERLVELAGDVQRVGLSATQRPLADVARFLVGPARECACVDEGHLRALDLAVETPLLPLGAVASHEDTEVVLARIAELVEQHRTTLVFVQTRKLAERISARLRAVLSPERVACHHSSLSIERRRDAERRLKAGELACLVATASLELGIDVGEVDLVCQLGVVPSIATLLQRVGRAGHGIGRTPKGRIFPLTRDELVCATALVDAIGRGELDRTPQPRAPLDVLAQQLVAECVAGPRAPEELLALARRAHPYRDLAREELDSLLALHSGRRESLLHVDPTTGRVRATRRARLVALTSGGAIPDRADYPVVLDPEGVTIGSVDEDFAVESSAGDVFQLGNASWRVLRIADGKLRVADAAGAPPSLPFWFGEAPARTIELSRAVGRVREAAAAGRTAELPLGPDAAAEIAAYAAEGARALGGAPPTFERLVVERFFDDTGGMQLVIHSCRGGRVNRALGLALRKRFCRRFGFEIQAAATEEAIVISLGPQHAFPLEEVLGYLSPETARDVLVQALLPTPMFTTRWRWNVQRALLLPRSFGGKRVPAPIQRMRADDLLVEAFPDVVACGENLPPGDLEVPLEHPLVRQTIEDCLTEAMDVDGLVALLEDVRAGRVEVRCVDTPEPSAFARDVLHARPYAFLDDAPLEERRTQAVLARRALDPREADAIGALDPAAVARVREEAWPDPRDAEELAEALGWMGWVEEDEVGPWRRWLDALAAEGRVVREGERWRLAGGTTDPREQLAGRLSVLGPVPLSEDDPLARALEAEGRVLRVRFEGRHHWCDRRLLARIQRYTLEELRAAIRPVPPAAFLAFLARRHGLGGGFEGPRGVGEAVRRLAGAEATAPVWERAWLPARVAGYRPEWLDELLWRGEVAWGRLWGSGSAAPRSAPVALVPREELDGWLGLAGPADREGLDWPARAALEVLERRGALFADELGRRARLLDADLERALGELAARGLATCDSFAGLRRLLAPAARRRRLDPRPGRWSPWRVETPPAPDPRFAARVLLARYGVILRAVVLRERLAVPWRELLRELRAMELAGELRGGRFVSGVSGEQFALPEAVSALRRAARESAAAPAIPPGDPLDLARMFDPLAPSVAGKAPVAGAGREAP